MAKKLNLFLVGPTYPFRGGIAHFGDSMARQLRSHGHKVNFCNFRRLYPQILFPGKTQFEARLATPPDRSDAWLDTLNPWSWYKAAKMIATAGCDAVVFQYWEPMLAPVFGTMARLLRREKIKVLCVVHNAQPHQHRPCSGIMGRFFMNHCDRLVALSAKVETDLIHLKPKPHLRRLYHPIYDHFGDAIPKAEARSKLSVDSTARVVLFFGLIRKYKGLRVLLEAVRRVLPKLPELQLIVAGEFYEGKAECCAFVKDHSMERHVMFVDRYIPTSDVAHYFCAADVVVMPYLSATQSGVLSTAYHFERPFIVSDVGGMSEMVPSELNLAVRSGDAAALSGALFRFFSENRSEYICDVIRTHKRNYTWTRFCADLEDELGNQ